MTLKSQTLAAKCRPRRSKWFPKVTLERKSWISKNVCFTVVKPYFLKSGRGPGSWLFYIVFLHRYFYAIFFGIVRICWSSGCPWGSKCVTLLSLMPPSGSSDRGRNHFGAPIWPPRLPNGPKWCQKRPQSFQNVSETNKKTKKNTSKITCMRTQHA